MQLSGTREFSGTYIKFCELAGILGNFFELLDAFKILMEFFRYLET